MNERMQQHYTIQTQVFKLIRKERRGFNELCRSVNFKGDDYRKRRLVAMSLIRLEKAGLIESNMFRLGYETDKRWVRLWYERKQPHVQKTNESAPHQMRQVR